MLAERRRVRLKRAPRLDRLEVHLRLLLTALRLTSIAGMILAVIVFITVAFFARLAETLTAAILFALGDFG